MPEAWVDRIRVTSYGLRIGIQVNSTAPMSRILECLPPRCKPAPWGPVDRLYSLVLQQARNVLRADASIIARTPHPDMLYARLDSDLRQFLCRRARRRVFVHAGVVGWRGRAIVIPGRSYSGKTTLVASLLKMGAAYYSDEYAVLDARGRVHAYPRLLSIRSDYGPPVRYSAGALGGISGSRSLPVGLVLATKFKPGAEWRPRPLTQGQAIVALLAHTPAARHKPRSALAALRQATSRATALQGPRGESQAMVEALRETLDALG